ncbi:MAG: FtsQ-type POTRA domain-containing protein [Parachlamydiaceae bacterium]|nr:FtsQ-type POTRA domain-containing protein [Parachlamydiaceae bacterium]
MKNSLPWKKAFKWIISSTLVTSALTSAGVFYWNHHQEDLTTNDRYNIVALCQSCSHKELLQTDFLAEILGLSFDKPTNLYRFDINAAKQKLSACPIIKSVELKKVKPSMLFLEYSLRQPIAYLVEYANTAIDSEGILIPSMPFYTPKNLYELVLGLPSGLDWGMKITGNRIILMQELLEDISRQDYADGFRLTRIDVSKAYSKRCGEREIVLFFEESIENGIENKVCKNLQLTLRLSPDNWHEQLTNYQSLRQKLRNEARGVSEIGKPFRFIIDMRLSQLAFIQEVKEDNR